MSLPFPGDLASTANGLLLLSLVSAILYGAAQGYGPSLRRGFARVAATGLLAALSVARDGPLLLTGALALCALADAARIQRDERIVLAGLAALLAAHLVYAALFATLWHGADIVLREPWRIAAGLALLALCGVMAIRLLPAAGAALRLPVGAFTAAGLAMGTAALAAPGWGVAAGAALFVASDALLAARRFLLAPGPAADPRLGLAIWTAYYAAQALLALALLM